MPNSCYNTITISSEEQTTIDFLRNSEFLFEKIRPLPEYEKENWYDWQINNWGTKWDRYNYKLGISGKLGFVAYFTTAWSPPIELLKYIVDKYNVKIKCDFQTEDGIAGLFVSNNKQTQYITYEGWCPEEELQCFSNE
jgi:hypothetical protein